MNVSDESVSCRKWKEAKMNVYILKMNRPVRSCWFALLEAFALEIVDLPKGRSVFKQSGLCELHMSTNGRTCCLGGVTGQEFHVVIAGEGQSDLWFTFIADIPRIRARLQPSWN
jgi:hypothetical protein